MPFPDRALVLLTALAAVRLAPALPTKAPSFECTDGDKVTYRAWLLADVRETNVLQVVANGKARELVLSGPNASRERPIPGGPVYYSGWNAKGTDLATQLDMSTELVTHYIVDKTGSKVKVGIVVDDRERTGLTCRANGISTTVTALADEEPAGKRNAALIAEVTSIRAQNGTITPFGIVGVEAALRRQANSPEMKTKEGRDAFFEAVALPVKNMDPTSVNRVSNSLKGPAGELWKTTLKEIRYAYYPEATRYAAWIKEGVRPKPYRDLPSVIAALNKFVKCPGFKDKDIQRFFIQEVTGPLRQLTPGELGVVRSYLSVPAQSFAVSLWSKAKGLASIQDHPEVQEAARELASVVDDKEFDPQKVQKKLTAFAHSPLAANPTTRLLYLQAAGPIAKRLNARQREDVQGWLEESAERALFAELLR